MPDIIKLLPDNIANQIAAGEVIQRPASVVKELLENAIDAGAEQIKLILKDSGKTLIQIIDDGVGMSEMDARLSFERHATSKISTADDLFHINTKGFRGEALASIAAISHVEMVTKQANSDTGTRILIAGSKVEKTEVVQAAKGTSIAVKNLFYNVPARRKFLKSDPVELKHVIEEFYRLVFIHCDIHFVLQHNGNDVYYLPKSSQKQRIINILGKSYQDKLLTINEDTEYASFNGFVLKSEACKRSSGEQYLFINNRFVKNNYLNHAVKSGYEGLLSPDQFPSYFIDITIDPSQLDINISPTKTEVKFEDERLVYNYLKVATKHALGVYVSAPTFDFDTNVNIVDRKSNSHQSTHRLDVNYPSDADRLAKENLKSWQSIYEKLSTQNRSPQPEVLTITSQLGDDTDNFTLAKEPYQLHQRYIITPIKSGFLIIDQQAAHERILYEENLQVLKSSPRPSQKELFPQVVELDAKKSVTMMEILPHLVKLGFEIGEFGNNSFILHGSPVGMTSNQNPIQMVDALLTNYQSNLELHLGVEGNLARSYAKSSGIKNGNLLTKDEMKAIVDRLFACETPFVSPSGKKCFIDIPIEQIEEKFK
jgi:DNA mismatch repair protein MutL